MGKNHDRGSLLPFLVSTWTQGWGPQASRQWKAGL